VVWGGIAGEKITEGIWEKSLEDKTKEVSEK
jgi:hypothetical protein